MSARTSSTGTNPLPMHLDAEHHLRAQREKQRRSAILGTSSHPYTTCMLHIMSPPSSYRNLRTHSLLASEPIQLSPMQFIDNHVFNSHHLVADLPLQIRVLLLSSYSLDSSLQLNKFSSIIFFKLNVFILTHVRRIIAM